MDAHFTTRMAFIHHSLQVLMRPKRSWVNTQKRYYWVDRKEKRWRISQLGLREKLIAWAFIKHSHWPLFHQDPAENLIPVQPDLLVKMKVRVIFRNLRRQKIGSGRWWRLVVLMSLEQPGIMVLKSILEKKPMADGIILPWFWSNNTMQQLCWNYYHACLYDTIDWAHNGLKENSVDARQYN